MTSSGFWANKRVLVTGHTGFKGSWLVRWLSLLGAEVSGYALEPDQKPALFALARLDQCCRSELADIRDLERFQRFVAEIRPEIVLHLAAQSLVRRSYRDPVATYATNVMGTVHLLEALRKVDGVRAVVIVTTDKCYENREWPWGYRETDALGGHDPYSSSKACAEVVTSAYRRSFLSNVGVASARAGNVIGGGDWSEDRLLPDIVRSAQSGVPVVIRNPASTRPWQHVLEPLSGYLLLCEKLWHEPDEYAEAWNFGPAEGQSLPVGEVAERFVRALGAGKLEIGKPDAAAPHEARSLELDARKARLRLKWRARLDVLRAIDQSAHWYRGFLADGGSARSLLDGQIRDYESLGS